MQLNKIKGSLKTLREIEIEIYEFFGFKERWQVTPIDDSTNQFWYVKDNMLYHANTAKELKKEEDGFLTLITGEIYRREKLTAIQINIGCDFNPDFLIILDNKKEVKRN